MNNKKSMAIVYTSLHFFVDLTTIYLISSVILGPEIGIVHRGAVVIVYNLLAFAGQLPIGILSDIFNKNRMFVVFGCLMAGVAYPVAFISPWIACVLASIGNGAFHIGAGADILKWSMPKAGLSGLFVSSGALGVWLAYKLESDIVVFVLPAIVILSAVILLVTGGNVKHEEKEHSISFVKPEKTVLAAILCFMMTIVVRSLMGMVMNYSWKSIFAFSLLSVIAVVAGKALGGYIADRFGYIKTSVVSLGLSFLLFIFSFEVPVSGILAILFFNMTMPLTLTAIAELTGKKYGFAFGLTTFALAIGFIPVVFGAAAWFSVAFVLICSGISLLLMSAGYLLMRKNNKDRCGNDMDSRNIIE